MLQDKLINLRQSVEAIFCTKMYKEKCILRYNHTWDHLADFMDSHNEQEYTEQVGLRFLREWHGEKGFSELTHRQQERVRHIDVLTNMLLTGEIRRSRHVNKVYEFDGGLGIPFRHFIKEMSDTKKSSSLRRYEERINELFLFLKAENLQTGSFSIHLAIKFLEKLDKEKSAPDRNNIVMTNRVFIRFLCGHNMLPDNNSEKWMQLFKLRYIRNSKIPSVYTAEEVEAVIAAIDRCHPQGKRDYAMVLLAARYGLRVSDIIGLRFCNLDWEHNRISLVQQKTGRKVNLPLSEEIGNAIIEYIRYGRPSIDLPFVFITAHAPYKELGSNVLCLSISKWMRAAGIDSTGKKRGPHSLRHSLATNLLNLNEPLPVISEILGHSTVESTTTYTRVSIDMLRQCALDVPFVPSSFYANLYE